MICQTCGVEAATKYVAFYENTGAVVVRFYRSIEGNLCKSCIHRHFWSFTGTTFVLGWWGTISFFVTPFIILNNLGRYLLCLFMPSVPPGAEPPRLTDEVVERITPHFQDLVDRLNRGEGLADAAEVISKMAGVTPGQVILFVQAVARAQSER
jgi:hypothetical protein